MSEDDVQPMRRDPLGIGWALPGEKSSVVHLGDGVLSAIALVVFIALATPRGPYAQGCSDGRRAGSPARRA
jgi:hypothetical protein